MNLQIFSSQRGAALITALVIVFVIAMLGTAIGLQVVSLNKASTANYDQTMSFANADSALAEGGAVVIENAYTGADDLDDYVVTEKSSATWWTDSEQWSSAVILKSGGNPLEGEPQYLIEDLGSVAGNLDMGSSVASRHFYRVTAKAKGKGDASTFLQSNYAIWE